MKVSVIVPSYNTEKVIGQCLGSIINQTLEDIEIIVVDDGSTDNTVAIANEYAQKDSRITVVPKEHENAGVSRNVGLDRAQGEYVVFWDADDFFELNALELLYNKSKEDDADICLCDAWHFNQLLKLDEEGTKIDFEYIPDNTPFSRKTIPDTIYNVTANVPWNKMFRTSFVKDNDIRFQSLPKANDAYFNLIAMALAERITYIPEKLVHWRYDQKISTTTDLNRSPMCVFDAFEAAYKKLNELGIYEEIQKSFVNKALGSYLYVMSCQKGKDALNIYRQMYDYIKNDAFKKIGVEKVLPEDVQKMKKYDRLQMIENGSYEEFLLWREASQAGAFNKKVKAKMALLNDQIKELKAEKKELKAQIKELKASTEYKIGRKVTWLPRKIDSIKQQREQSNENQSDQAVDNDLKADKDTLPEEE